MNLQELMTFYEEKTGAVKHGISEERIQAHFAEIRNLIAFYREYPDLLVDEMIGPDSTFKFFTYQRIFLRVAMRHRYVFATFPRGYSKSFLTMMVLMLRCVLYPGSHLFVSAGGKEQAASITLAKVSEICGLIPALSNEIDWSRGVSKTSKNDVKYIFKNGSSIDILAASERSRGQRRTGGVLEECVSIDQTILNEILIPTTNVDRLLPDGTRDKDEVVNKSQIYITTSGWKNSFAYQRNIELLIQSLIEPDKVMVLGGSWKTPVAEGLLDEDFVEDLKLQDTYNDESFEREYCSHWSGDVENAFYSSEKFERSRLLNQPESEYTAQKNINGKGNANIYYVIGVDVGRINCTTEAIIIKVAPQSNGAALKSIVNIHTYDAEHFEEQAIHLKKLFYKYKARAMAIDANGLGIGLVDYLVKTQVDPETGENLPPFGVINDDENLYKKFRTPDTELDALYLIKANIPFNTEAYSYTQTQMGSGRIRFLIDEAQAKAKLLSTKVGQNMTSDQRSTYLKPYVQTSILRDQLLNLVETSDGVNIILKQSSRSIPKDKVSALIYGLYYVKMEEQKRAKRRVRDFSKLMLFS